MSKKYLSSFYPLNSTSAGKKAVAKCKLPPFIDGSCRREPDFENEFPCITGLCRPGFAEKLNIEDVIVYVTNKKGIGSRKVIAVLGVIKVFANHREAADWYIKKNKSIPNNIMVDETKPFDLDNTHKKMGWEAWITSANSLQKWNEGYEDRASKYPKVVQCTILYRELNTPIALDQTKFRRKLIAQNPPILFDKDWETIKELIQI